MEVISYRRTRIRTSINKWFFVRHREGHKGNRIEFRKFKFGFIFYSFYTCCFRRHFGTIKLVEFDENLIFYFRNNSIEFQGAERRANRVFLFRDVIVICE